MSSCATSKAWVVATSVGVVEVLKDQGLCKWNYVLRCAQQHLKTHVRSLAQAKNVPSTSSSLVTRKKDVKAKQAEESLRTVMYLCCWGPSN
ncbi:hypothetical protein Lalb_Chr14g0366581 [Lupinus albus]|uniref:Wound-responsive family protein n=1 Tax=Lupinus albus TaxID=3870 RepID=A0A6A4P9N1_LUPAL|nr:hypothetical protein Lalb_Chr14g0366581 [Lupinus albus]